MQTRNAHRMATPTCTRYRSIQKNPWRIPSHRPSLQAVAKVAKHDERREDVDRLLGDGVQRRHPPDVRDEAAARAGGPTRTAPATRPSTGAPSPRCARSGSSRRTTARSPRPGPGPPGAARSQAPPQEERQRDESHAAQNRVQPQGDVALAQHGEERGRDVEQKRPVIGGIVAVGVVNQQRVGEVAVHRLVVVGRPRPQVDQPENERAPRPERSRPSAPAGSCLTPTHPVETGESRWSVIGDRREEGREGTSRSAH